MAPSKNIPFALALLVATLSAGCASSHMTTVAAPAAVAAPDPSATTMVFYRTSVFGGAIQSSVFDVTDDVELVGIVSTGTKVAYAAPPGRRRYMVIGESADFMEVDGLAGRTYHARVRPRFGWWKARFSLVPIPAAHDDLRDDLEECDWVENTPSSRQWAEENMPSIRAKMAEDVPEWEAKPNPPRLAPEDGALTPIAGP